MLNCKYGIQRCEINKQLALTDGLATEILIKSLTHEMEDLQLVY